MYLYQPCLIALSLYVWAYEPGAKLRYLKILFPMLILALSEWELTYAGISIYPAALLLALYFGIHAIAWPEVLTASLVGGLVCWKMADVLPLFSGLSLWNAALMLLLSCLLCSSREDRLLSCAMGSLFFELFFCLKEYMLFSFCQIRLGSRDSLSLGALCVCLYMVLEPLLHGVHGRLKRADIIGN